MNFQQIIVGGQINKKKYGMCMGNLKYIMNY